MEPSSPGARAAALGLGAVVVAVLAVVAVSGEDQTSPADSPSVEQSAAPSLSRSAGPSDGCELPGSGHDWEIGLRDPGRQPDCDAASIKPPATSVR